MSTPEDLQDPGAAPSALPGEDAAEAPPPPPPLPLGVGRVSGRLVAFVLAMLAVLGWGLFAFSQQLLHGEIVTGMRTLGAGGVPWGLYIVSLVYFIGLGYTGITAAAAARVFHMPALQPFTRIAEVMTLTALVLGLSCILADLGDPLNGLLNLPRVARISSPFFGTFTLVVGGFLFPTLVYLYLSGRADAAALMEKARGSWLRPLYVLWASGFKGTGGEKVRHHHAALWLALVLLPVETIEQSTLGLIFGIQGGRPGWYSALQAPSFVVLAATSGLSALVIIAAILRWALDLGERLPRAGFRQIGNAIWVLTGVFLYLIGVDLVTAHYAASAAVTRVAQAVVLGPYAPAFWSMVALLFVPMMLLFVQYIRGTSSIALAVASGLMINVAAMIQRFLIVIPSQTHGQLLPFPVGHYHPSWVELSFIAGLFALGALLITLFVKLFPILPLHEAPRELPEPEPEAPGARLLRRLGFGVSLLAGLGLAVVGFLVSARVGTSPDADPLILWSPVVFIAGLMLIFYSAVVYEVFPPVKAPEP